MKDFGRANKILGVQIIKNRDQKILMLSDKDFFKKKIIQAWNDKV